jgi:hypothetical protein
MHGNFCARMTSHWKIVKDFLKSDLKEQVVNLTPAASVAKECIDMGLDKAPITMRLLRIELLSGETEVLATTLTDLTRYHYDLFAELYHQRWFVEIYHFYCIYKIDFYLPVSLGTFLPVTDFNCICNRQLHN